MMIGPEPMTRTFLISERLGTHVLPDEFEKPVVQELGIRGARPSLGMELHRECRQRPVPEAFHGRVVQIYVRYLQRSGNIRLNRKPMFLCGDYHVAGGDHADNLVASAIAQSHLVYLDPIEQCN